ARPEEPRPRPPSAPGRRSADPSRAHGAAGRHVDGRAHLRPEQREHVHLSPGTRRGGPPAAPRISRHPAPRTDRDLDTRRCREATVSRGESMKVRYLFPLVGFVVPTAMIGYGVVIPRSCIAGVNDLTIGFAASIIGACVTYLLGLRTVLRDQRR